MNKESQVSNSGVGKGNRRSIVIGAIIAVGFLALAAVLLLKPAAPSQPMAPRHDVGTVDSPEPGAGTAAGGPGTSPNAPLPQSTVGSASTTSGGHAAVGAKASISDLVKRLKDSSLPLADRKEAIKALAQIGSPDAIAALKEALASASDELRAAVAERLGDCASPECVGILAGLLNDPNENVVRAAIKGLAQQGSPTAVDALNKMLYDQTRSVDIRIASIDGLGTINQPSAFEALSQAATTSTDDDIIKAVLNALGGRNFDETQTFFQNYLRNPNVSPELRVEATEALANAQGDPTPFLSTLAADSDSDVRASAAWAMSATSASGNIAPELLGIVQAETDPDVRLRLYQALANQDNLDPAAVLAAVRSEKDPAAYVTALDLVAKTLRSNPTTDLVSFFDQTAVPALKNIALNGDSGDERMGAIIALVRANDSSVIPVMQDIGQQAKDPRVAQAANNFVNRVAAANAPSSPK